jgi:putative ABC transport system permease protein
VRDAKYRTIGEGPTPFFYVPAAQRYESTMWLLIRPRGPGVLPQVRGLIRAMDPNVPILQAAPLTDLTAFTLFPQRFAAWLAAIVGATGLLLAALGVYGVTAYNVSQRRREIGIRVALGAVRAEVLRSILGQGIRLAAAGAALGLTTAALASHLLEGLLYDIQPLDPVSFAGAAAVIVALAVLASAIPARRAAAIDPAETLRAE